MFSYSQNDELEFWGKMNFKEKITKNFTFSLEPGSRYNLDNFFFTKQFLDLSFSRLIYKGNIGILTSEIGGRLTKLPNQISLAKRQYFTLNYSKKIKKITFSWRSRLFFEQNITDDKKKYLRNKVTFQYSDFDFIRPFFDLEYLCGLNSKNIDKFRYSIGNSFKMSKKRTIKLFYRMQHTLESNVKKKRIFGIYLIQKL